MSRTVSVPILEVVTLLVVLFACGLVLIPGMDDYATSMLLRSDREANVDANLLVEETAPAIVRNADRRSSEIESSMQEASTRGETEHPPSVPIMEQEDTLELELDASDLQVNEPLLAGSGAEIDAAKLFEEQLDSNDFASSLNRNESADTSQPEPQGLNQGAKIAEENSAGLPMVSPDNDWDMEFLDSGNPSDNSSTENSLQARFSPLPVSDLQFETNSSHESVPNSVESMNNIKQWSGYSDNEDQLPKVLSGAGKEPSATEQAAPVLIRMPSNFDGDNRRVFNPTFYEFGDNSSSRAADSQSQARIINMAIEPKPRPVSTAGNPETASGPESSSEEGSFFRSLPPVRGVPNSISVAKSIGIKQMRTNELADRISRQPMTSGTMTNNNDFRPIR